MTPNIETMVDDNFCAEVIKALQDDDELAFCARHAIPARRWYFVVLKRGPQYRPFTIKSGHKWEDAALISSALYGATP